MAADEIAELGEARPGEPLLAPAMRAGKLVISPSLDEHRAVAASNLHALPAELRLADRPSRPYAVSLSPRLQRHAPAPAP